MEPYGREGTTFIVSFTPVEYGKIRKGKLVIQTEDLYWSYIVKGVLPRYIVPKAKESNIDCNLDAKFSQQISQIVTKNFLADNIRKSKYSPKMSQNKSKVSKLSSTMFPMIKKQP